MNLEGVRIPQEQERVLVWCMLHDDRGDFAPEVFNRLTVEDFGDLFCSRMVALIRDAMDGGRSYNLNLMALAYAEKFKADEIETQLHVTGWYNGETIYVPNHEIDDYTNIVHRCAVYRRLITVGQKVIQIGMDGTSDAGEAIAEAESLFREYTQFDKKSKVITPRERQRRIEERHEERKEEKYNGNPPFTSWGFDQLDKATNGMGKGRLYVVGGWSSDGKSTLLWSIARNAANVLGKVVVYVTVEMLEEHISDRDMAAEIGVDSQNIESANLTREQERDFYEATERIGQGSLYIFDEEPIYVEDLYDHLMDVKREAGRVDLLVTDYLQIMSTRKKCHNREGEVAHLAKTHRQLAKQFKIPVVTASQFNQEVVRRDNKKPVTHDFRESQGIVHEAWALLGLYIPSRNKDQTLSTQAQWDKDGFLRDYLCPEHQTEIVICKQRGGQRDINIRVGWNPQTATHYQPLRKDQQIYYPESVAPMSYNGNGRNAPPMPPAYDIDEMDF